MTRREGKALACKLYRVGEGRALYAGVLKAAGARAFVEAAPGAEYRYRNAPLRRMTAGELAAAVEPGRVYDYDLLGAEDAGRAARRLGGNPAAGRLGTTSFAVRVCTSLAVLVQGLAAQDAPCPAPGASATA